MSGRAGDWSFAAWFGVAFALSLAAGLVLVLLAGSMNLLGIWTVFASAVTVGLAVGVLALLFGRTRPSSGKWVGR